MNSLLDGQTPSPPSKNNRTRNVHIKHVSSVGISYMNIPLEIYTVSAGIQSNEPRSTAGWYVRIVLHLLMSASYIVNIVSTCLQNTTSAKQNQQHIRQKHKEGIGGSYVQQNLLILRVCSIIYALLVMGIHTYSTTDIAANNWLQYASPQSADSRDLLGLRLEQKGWGKLARRGRDNASAKGGALEKKEMCMDSISLPMSCLQRTCWLAMGACFTMLPFWYWNTSSSSQSFFF